MTTNSCIKPPLMVTCPYNIKHRLNPSKLNLHTLKCPNRFNQDIVVCPFNTAHRIPKSSLADHLLECRWAAGYHCANMIREQLEWDALFEKKNKKKQPTAAAILAAKMGGYKIPPEFESIPTPTPPPPPSNRSSNYDPSWDTVGGTLYVIPGLEDDRKPYNNEIFPMNSFRYKRLTAKEKEAYRRRTVLESLANAAKAKAAEALKKEQMRLVQLEEKTKQEEKKAKEEAQREKLRNDATKIRSSKDQLSAIKRRVFLALQKIQGLNRSP